MPPQPDLAPMRHAVRQAIDLTRRVSAAGTQASAKGDASPVTVADYGAQALICRAIATHYPGDAVIAEETSKGFRSLLSAEDRAYVAALLTTITEADAPITPEQVIHWLDYGQNAGPSGSTWVIDPIDGTVGFVNGRYYAVCVARMVGYQPTEAVVGLPRSPLDAAGTILHTDGTRVIAAAVDGSNVRDVCVSSRGVGEARALDSYKIPAEDQALNAAIRARAGMAATPPDLYDSQLKYAMVAAGHVDLFVRLPRDIAREPHYIWDHAVGTALIRAAGGQHTDLYGNPLDYSQGAALPHTGFIASNGVFHDALIAAAATELRL